MQGVASSRRTWGKPKKGHKGGIFPRLEGTYGSGASEIARQSGAVELGVCDCSKEGGAME